MPEPMAFGIRVTRPMIAHLIAIIIIILILIIFYFYSTQSPMRFESFGWEEKGKFQSVPHKSIPFGRLKQETFCISYKPGLFTHFDVPVPLLKSPF